MKVLVTGSRGFLGQNLIAELHNIQQGKSKLSPDFPKLTIYQYNRSSSIYDLEKQCLDADFVFHLAGTNRPKDESEYMEVNHGLTSILVETLKKTGNNCPVMMASSIQAERDNPYGVSKKAGEELLIDYGRETGAKVLIYRFPNLFGKWGRPNYNSAVITFCHNIAHDLSIKINDRTVMLTLSYVDDVIEEMINALRGNPTKVGGIAETDQFYKVPTVHQITLGEIVDLIYSFKESRESLQVADLSDAFTKKLYSTYLSYLPVDGFSYPLKMNVDERGSFTEFLKSPDRGQVSINISKPGITKGQHWHHTKNEKFLVVSGNGVIRFRKIDEDKVYQYFVTGDKLEVVDIPVGYTHNIENLGTTDMVTVMWVNEVFDPEHPDTYFLPV